jgi:ABC-type dipeptide/oligopeptide/nickel transport system permease subunit
MSDSKSNIRKFWMRPKVIFAVFVLIVAYGGGIFSAVLAPYDYAEQDLSSVRQGPSMKHLLGTDFVGRDNLSRIIYSLRTNLIVTFAAVVTGSGFLGIFLGLISGYFGGWIDFLVMRIGDIFLAFPGLLLVILIAATIRPRLINLAREIEDATFLEGLVRWGVIDYVIVFGSLAAFGWVGVARMVRGQVLQLSQFEYVVAGKAIGASTPRILLRHIFPNALPPIIVVLTMGMGSITGAEVILSWLGIGIQPPTPSLGSMIREAQNISILQNYPHMLIPPVLVVALLIFAWNLLGDAINDLLNPRSR